MTIDEREAWLASLKPGDRVGEAGHGFGQDKTVRVKVLRRTRAGWLVVSGANGVERKFKNGSHHIDTWHSLMLVPWTQVEEEALERRNLAAALSAQAWAEKPLEILRAVAAALVAGRQQ